MNLKEYQEKGNEETAKFYNLLPPGDKKKYDAITECFKILKEADVLTLMFCELPGRENTKNNIIQYNNAADLLNPEYLDKVPEESLERLIFMSYGASSEFCRYVYGVTGNCDDVPPWEAIHFYTKTYINYTSKGIIIPEIKALRERIKEKEEKN